MRPRYALAYALLLTAPLAARADDAADARALVDKALTAHGGADKLAKLPGVTLKLKGTFHGLGQALEFKGSIASQGADRFRLDMEFVVADRDVRVQQVLNGAKGWQKLNADVTEMDEDDLAEAKEQAYAGWVSTLVPLTDKEFKLATAGEIKVDKRPALGVKVARKGRRDVTLYFDKETALLVKMETRVKDETGEEKTEESVFSNYKDVQGTKQAFKVAVQRDAKPYLEADVTECTLAEKLGAATFAKP